MQTAYARHPEFIKLKERLEAMEMGDKFKPTKGANIITIINLKTHEVVFEIDFQKTSEEYRNRRISALSEKYPLDKFHWMSKP